MLIVMDEVIFHAVCFDFLLIHFFKRFNNQSSRQNFIAAHRLADAVEHAIALTFVRNHHELFSFYHYNVLSSCVLLAPSTSPSHCEIFSKHPLQIILPNNIFTVITISAAFTFGAVTFIHNAVCRVCRIWTRLRGGNTFRDATLPHELIQSMGSAIAWLSIQSSPNLNGLKLPLS